uniref:InlB B-repeat-containing protein n=1 Tax=Coprococcus catus TaxID=116085 RepID=UPI001C03532C|nr:X2-like carbohydrate binding domain-containing protein [Coprococcus catus]
MRKKRWMSIMLVLCMILTLLPINTAYADEADTQKDANQVEEVQSDEDIVMQTEQVEEVKPDESVAMQAEQVEEVEPDESVAMQDEQVEEAKPDESVAMQDEQVEEAESDEDAVMEETVKPAVRMLAPAAVSPAASPEKIKEIELNLKPVTEITNINDFKSITYSPSDKIHLEEVTVYNGYNSTSGSIASVYTPDKGYTVVYEFTCDKNAYELRPSYSKVKINSKYIQNWDWECKFSWGSTLKVYVFYPSLKNKVGVTFKPRDQWSGNISSMYVGHDLGDAYSVVLDYYSGLNQISNDIGSDTAYDSTKDYSVRITIAGKRHAATISPDLTKDDVTINYGTIWKITRDDTTGYTRIYVNFPKEDSNTEYTVKAKNAEIMNEAGEPVSKAKAGTVLTVKLKDLEKGYAFEKWAVDDNSTDVEFQNVKSTTTTFVMPKGEVYISPATLRIANVYSKKLTYNGEEQTGVYLHDVYGGGSSIGTLTGHKATEAGTYTARASLNKGYIWSDGTTEDKNIVWTIDKADRDGPRGLRSYMPTKEGANDGGILATTTEMEYRKVGTTTWKDCPDKEVTGLSTGDYEVRYKDTKSYNRSIAIIYTVPIWGPKTWITWIENGTPDGIQLPKNATITITANPPEKGKEFDKWVPNASSNVKFEDEKSEVTKMTVLGGNVTVRATYKDKETPGALKYDLNVINGQGTGKYAINKTVEITANPAPEGKEFDKWVVVEDTVAVADITKPKTTLTTKGVDAWVVATYKDIGSVAVDHTLTVVNGSIYSSSNPGKFKRNEAVTLYSKEIKNFDKWVVTSGSVVAILPNENTLNVTIITSDEDTTIEATRKSDASVHTHTYGVWSNDDADHWHECTDAACTDKAGSVKDKAGHVYDDDADTTCNVCGYVRTVTPPAPVHTHTYGAWSNDDTDHWHECTDASCTDRAGSIKDKAGHVYDDAADTTCNVCGYVRTVTPPAPVHTHTYGAWSNDDTDHWHECTDASCTDKAGSVKDKAAHVYDDDVDTTCNVCGYIRTVTPPTITPDYKFLEGANGKWTKSSDKNLAFRANGEFSKFTGVKVDGTKIDADKYTAVSGSTIVNLKKEYLETLSVGKHTLTVVYTDGECSTEFEIKAASTAKKDTTDKENKSSKTTAAKLDNAKTPKTGDNSNILLWFTLLFSSGVVLMGKAFANKKRKQDR